LLKNHNFFVRLFLYLKRYSPIATKSISIYQLEKGEGERNREFKERHIIIRHQKYKPFAELQGQAQQGREEMVILSYKEEDNIRNREQGRTKRTVMICDDERDILLMFAIELRTKYNVLTAQSGEECIKKYQYAKLLGRNIDLILLDYKLGDTTGSAVAHKIKELNDVKIIMITAYEVNHELVRDLKENECIVDIVQKPIDIDSLMAKVARDIGN
jgi:CheY-like chemotaxis protein